MHLQGKVTDKIHIYEAHEVHSRSTKCIWQSNHKNIIKNIMRHEMNLHFLTFGSNNNIFVLSSSSHLNITLRSSFNVNIFVLHSSLNLVRCCSLSGSIYWKKLQFFLSLYIRQHKSRRPRLGVVFAANMETFKLHPQRVWI